MDATNLLELGVAGGAILVVVMVIDLLRRWFRQTEQGDRRKAPQVVGCPNKVEGLAETLGDLRDESRANRKIQEEQLRVLRHVEDGTTRLVDQHKAGPDGVESWKISPRMLRLQEETRDLLRDLVVAVKKNGR